MTGPDRFVVLGVASPRRTWFREVATWATGGAVPIEFIKCLSVEEVRARLGGGRAYSALLVDDQLPGIDRDLFEAASDAGCAVVVVGADNGRWRQIGARAVVPADLGVATLLDVLSSHASRVDEVRHDLDDLDAPTPLPLYGRLVTVLGPPGAGTSTVAASLAAGLAERDPGTVLLADLALDADQALLHGTGDIVPGLQDLVEAFRVGAPDDDTVRAHLVETGTSGHALLPGLRRHRDWAALRPRSVTAAIEALQRLFPLVVADATGDLEGADDCGAIEVEERNLLARHAVTEADLIVVVFRPDVRGLRRAAVMVEHVAALTGGDRRVLPVANGSPRHPRRRSEIAAAVSSLCVGAALQPTVFLPMRQRLALAQRDGTPTCRPFPEVLAGAVRAILATPSGPAALPVDTGLGTPVTPGSLGAWTEEATG